MKGETSWKEYKHRQRQQEESKRRNKYKTNLLAKHGKKSPIDDRDMFLDSDGHIKC